MDWLKERFQEKTTYAGLATVGLTLANSIIPIPFAGELIQLVAGAILFGVKEHKMDKENG